MVSTIERVRAFLADGTFSKASLARAAGLHANTLRGCTEDGWNPTSDTLAKLDRFLDAQEDTPVIVPIEELIAEARNGRMFLLVDDEDRENEGDLVIPAQMATPDAINFMATHGRGLICLSLTRERTEQLGLDLMSRNNGSRHETAFTVSIEAREGVTTGISAADRARTVAVATDPARGSQDIVSPGHVFPLIARDGGVLVRAGHTEAAVDIARLAGLNPSGVICEVMREDGEMARLDDLTVFARKHGMKIGTIRDLIEYRHRYDHLVERLAEQRFESDHGGEWNFYTYRNNVDGSLAFALQKGRASEDEVTLVRVHTLSLLSDMLGQPGPNKNLIQRAMDEIGREGSGVIVLLVRPREGQGASESDAQSSDELRTYGIGAQILTDLGVHRMTLLSNSTRHIVGLDGFDLEIVGQREIPE
ncbi:3,4-dihydroxy-2-butanone-4-phosphate synthase [Erythrobacter sp. 3-20A1M]|uniref:3,4-dihydroxy-2-butanone-4-phosphate synthase n=1 Tax=Erythrobacter sp. 3-20A1M TaxID=2653850 RepID=UPI001BFC9727|nr:3,4-dihydroxy-2-butanone-4-phosphate synthase [Erythrobacter sp. 3-20A1M]QWC55684.1 3,4-dihydroxy-2-butanone-4-phosphate synthase [Erythrobacter sp. 3-20A1M]